MFVIEAEQKNQNEKQFFRYTNAKALMDYKGFNNFLNLLDEGLIRYDNRLGVHGPTTKLAGKPHNHGGGLRINPKNIHKLFNVNIDL